MGNCHPNSDYDQTKPIKSDEFIIRLHREQIRSGNQLCSDLIALDQRRLVFVSLIGLYQTWHLCPVSRLYLSIFVLPLKKKWIYDASKYQKEIKENIFGHHDLTIFKDKQRFNQFLELLRWKQSQNLVFWMLDEYELDQKNKSLNNSLVAPFWHYFDKALCDLYDPVKQTTYQPLRLDENFWRFTYIKATKSHFDIRAYKILSELYFVTKRFKAIQEIIFQSNPHSLNPIVAYNSDINHCIVANAQKSSSFTQKSQCHHKDNKKRFLVKDSRHKPGVLKSNQPVDCWLDCADFGGFVSFPNGCCPDIDDDDSDNDDNGVWMISSEYNEYDLDN